MTVRLDVTIGLVMELAESGVCDQFSLLCNSLVPSMITKTSCSRAGDFYLWLHYVSVDLRAV